jgi:hypothetical protein
MARTWWVRAVVATLLGSLLFAGCGDEKVVTLVQEPSIKVSVSASPDSLGTGGAVRVKASIATTSGGPFTYSWVSDGGSFANAKAESTVWTAPDDPGVYSLSVIVTDKKNVGIGNHDVAVATYIPAVTPFYRGAAYCALCHDGGEGGDEYDAWSQSVHAKALTNLQAIGQGTNTNCVGCHTVGSYGLEADEALANGGFDETAVARLGGVQCENCHSAGSEHPSVDFKSVEVSLDASLCGQCHTDEHHPTYDEWQSSAHAGVVEEAALRSSCAKCHNGLHSGEYLDDPDAFQNPSSNPTTSAPVVCAVCHDPHGNDNPGSLRDASVMAAALPNGRVIESAGAGRLCMACHNGRRTDTDVENQIRNGGRLGPHHSVQGDMLAGVNAYEKVDSTFAWASSKHILVQDACVTCHTHAHEGDLPNDIPNFTGHDFRPQIEACRECHGQGLASFRDVIAKQDFDGDGTTEGVQDEVEGLMEQLRETIIEASLTPEDSLALVQDFEGKLPDTTVTTQDQRKAGYNYLYVEFDGSKGVHNTTYAIQLLQRSMLFLDPGALPEAAYILTREE